MATVSEPRPPLATPAGAALETAASAVAVPFLPGAEPPATPESVWPLVLLPGIVIATGVAMALGAGLGALAISLVALASARFASRWRTNRRARAYDTDVHDVLRALGRGDHAGARALLVPWVRRGPAIVRVHARHNLAWTQLTDGRPTEAIGLLAANELAHDVLRALGMHATCALNLALAHALLGELAAGHAWLAEADRRAEARAQRRGTDPSMKVYARAILDCREDHPADAARDLEQQWTEVESTLTASLVRPVRILRAFAVAAADPRAAGRAERLIERPRYPGEFDFLGVAWPEMAAFLAAHGLGGAALDRPAVSRPGA